MQWVYFSLVSWFKNNLSCCVFFLELNFFFSDRPVFMVRFGNGVFVEKYGAANFYCSFWIGEIELNCGDGKRCLLVHSRNLQVPPLTQTPGTSAQKSMSARSMYGSSIQAQLQVYRHSVNTRRVSCSETKDWVCVWLIMQSNRYKKDKASLSYSPSLIGALLNRLLFLQLPSILISVLKWSVQVENLCHEIGQVKGDSNKFPVIGLFIYPAFRSENVDLHHDYNVVPPSMQY